MTSRMRYEIANDQGMPGNIAHFLLKDLSSVIPAFAFLRTKTKSLTIFIQKPDNNAESGEIRK